MAALAETEANFKILANVSSDVISFNSACKSAIFAAGAGRYPGPGGYTECAFTTKGIGQFRPGDAALATERGPNSDDTWGVIVMEDGGEWVLVKRYGQTHCVPKRCLKRVG